MEKAPDIVTLRFDVVARDPDQAKANQDVQVRANKVFAMLRDRKIADNDIIAESINSEAEFEENDKYPRQRGKLIGYKVTRSFTVKVRDVNGFPKLVDDLIGSANVEMSSPQTEFSKADEMNDQLWDKAVVKARQQADRMAKQTGMKIDSVFAISPTPIAEITSNMFPKGENGMERVIVTGSNIPTAEEGSRYLHAPISFGQTVHIIYLISPAASAK